MSFEHDPEFRVGLFQGPELIRFLALLSFLVLIVAMILSFSARQQAANPLPAEPADLPKPDAGSPPLPPPASGIEFEGLRDRTPMTPRDNPAYLKLLEKVRETTPKALGHEARRDVFFSQLIDNPERYRGLPIHLSGTIRRTMRQETPGSNLFEQGHYFESYATTPDSGKYPWILVFEEAPPEFPVGGDLKEPVRFDGYFLKLLAYEAGDNYRFAPLLVGRIHWEPSPEIPQPLAINWSAPSWISVALGLLVTLMLIRWTLYARGFFFRGSRRSARSTPSAIQDEIAPEELSAWVESQEESDLDDLDEDWENNEHRA